MEFSIVFATANPNKIREVLALLDEGVRIVSLKDIGCEEDIPETQPTIEGNALQKARYVKDNYKIDCFAEDTGLEINALGGEPGVYSARYAGEAKIRRRIWLKS
jgi:XTP/dITP diphosphohydrolase